MSLLQLLLLSFMINNISENTESDEEKNICLLSFNKCCDWNSKLSRFNPGVGNEKGEQTFYNQAFNTLLNYVSRTSSSLSTVLLV